MIVYVPLCVLAIVVGLRVAATVTAGTGYGRLAVALLLMGAGMARRRIVVFADEVLGGRTAAPA